MSGHVLPALGAPRAATAGSRETGKPGGARSRIPGFPDSPSVSTESRQASGEGVSTPHPFAAFLAALLPATPLVVHPTPPEGTSELATGVEGGEGAAGTEGESSTTAASGAAASGAGIVRSLDALRPEFRERLLRVMTRMREEFGDDVQVVETVRSQARQDALHAQGRTAPGPVVTWTRQSRHGEGLAADVMVNGGWTDAAALARLARVASEEGLRTLGPRDPGHVELPRASSATAASDATRAPARIDGPALPRPAASVAEVARVATVARVAEPARVARPARVAEPGAAPAEPAPFRPPQVAATTTPAERPANAGGESRGESSRREGGGAGERGDARSPQLEPRVAFASAPSETRGAGSDAAPARVAASTAPSTLERVLALRDDAAPREISRIELRLDDPSGGTERIRVDLRGGTVDATMELGDRATAERVTGRLAELRQALAQHGLESDALHVRHRAGTEATASLAGGLAEREATRPAATGNPSSTPERERRPGQEPASDHPSDRQRPRRERKGDSPW